jgi:hypothetical protein
MDERERKFLLILTQGVSICEQVYARDIKSAENGVSDLVENRRRAVLHHANLFCYDVLLSQTSRSWPTVEAVLADLPQRNENDN